MSDIRKHALLIILSSCFLITISQTNLTRQPLQQNQTNDSQSVQHTDKEIINHAILDYDFFSYDVIDHRTLLVKFDLTHSILYQQSNVFYDAELYVSKIPALNYKINIGEFLGFYEKQIDGTIIDHFTFCLVLTSNVRKNKFNVTSNRNKTETIFHRYLKSSRQKQQQYIAHYCTKIGPDEDRHRHHKKQGSGGDHVLLLLQIMMIGIFLTIIQIAHITRNQKYRPCHLPEFYRHRHEHHSTSPDGLGLLRFRTIDEEESQEPEEEEMVMEDDSEEEGSSDSSPRQLPSPITKRKRSRSSSPSTDRMDQNPDDSYNEHILESKPWVQTPK